MIWCIIERMLSRAWNSGFAAVLPLVLSNPASGMAREFLLIQGYILGAGGGFVMGTFAGAFCGGLNRNLEPVRGSAWLLRRQ
jgi:hypothetical protein